MPPWCARAADHVEPLFTCLRELVTFDASDPDQTRAMLEGCLSALIDPMLWLWVSVLTLLCTGIGALIGWFKGRTVAGLVWSTVLGPIGWIVIALAKPDRHACPRCAQPNREFAKRCRHCSAALDARAMDDPGRGGPP